MFIAPPLAEGDRWLRYAEKLGATAEVALAAKAVYYAAHGPERAAWRTRTAYPAIDVDLLVVQSRDDERNSVSDTQEVIPRNPRARLVLVDGLTHRRTARDPGVIRLVADFVDPSIDELPHRFQLGEVAQRVAVVPELLLEDGVDALLQRIRAVLEHLDRSREVGRRNRCEVVAKARGAIRRARRARPRQTASGRSRGRATGSRRSRCSAARSGGSPLRGPAP